MKERKALNITTESTNKIRNFYPCLICGRMEIEEPVHPQWKEIGWKIICKDENELMMVAVFYTEEGADARAVFYLNHITGAVSKYHFESACGFDSENAYDICSANLHFNKTDKAYMEIVKLVYYFKKVNDLEMQRVNEEQSIHQAGFAAFFSARNANTASYQETVFDPNAKKTPVHKGTSGKRNPYNFHTMHWQVRGHYRRLRNGIVKYIEPKIVTRKVSITA